MKYSALAVINPAAGFGKCAKLLGPALDRLRASGVRFDVAETQRAGHGIEIARNAFREGYRKFIAVGGDGTSFEIVNGLFPEAAGVESSEVEKPTLGFLPLGTGNSFLRDFTDDSVEYATRAIIEGLSRPCDVIRLKHRDGEVFFINILSLGFVADVATLANRRFKRLGAASYALAVVLCVRHAAAARVSARKVPGQGDQVSPATAASHSPDIRLIVPRDDRSSFVCAVLSIVCFLLGLLVPLILVAALPQRGLSAAIIAFIAGHVLAIVLGIAGFRHRLAKATVAAALIIGLGAPATFVVWSDTPRTAALPTLDPDDELPTARVTVLRGTTLHEAA